MVGSAPLEQNSQGPVRRLASEPVRCGRRTVVRPASLEDVDRRSDAGLHALMQVTPHDPAAHANRHRARGSTVIGDRQMCVGEASSPLDDLSQAAFSEPVR
jgi:hypothetical protein